MEAAVVAMPDEHWGERPCAFVTAKPDVEIDGADLIAWCRAAPRPVQSTGARRLRPPTQDLDRQDPKIRAPPGGRFRPGPALNASRLQGRARRHGSAAGTEQGRLDAHEDHLTLGVAQGQVSADQRQDGDGRAQRR